MTTAAFVVKAVRCLTALGNQTAQLHDVLSNYNTLLYTIYTAMFSCR